MSRMIDDDDQRLRQTGEKKAAYALGQPLDAFSVTELDEALVKLRAEIARLEAARAAKAASTAAAHAFFKK